MSVSAGVGAGDGGSVEHPPAAAAQPPDAASESPVAAQSPARPVEPTPAPASPTKPSTPGPSLAPTKPSVPKPATPAVKPAVVPKLPEHESEACEATRQAAADARDAGQYTKQLSHLAKKQCWSDAREHKRELVQALVAARQFDRCIAAGRGSADPVVVRAVGQCEALRGVVPE